MTDPVRFYRDGEIVEGILLEFVFVPHPCNPVMVGVVRVGEGYTFVPISQLAYFPHA